MDDTILVRLLATLLAVPFGMLIAWHVAQRRPEVGSFRLAFQIAFGLSLAIALLWMTRACVPMRGEDFGMLAAMFFGVVAVPLSFGATLLAAFLTLRHLRGDLDE